MIKRLCDLVCAVLALIALLPLLIPIGIALKLTGEHRIFYRQRRVGKNGAVFDLLKFTTMMDSVALRPDGGLALDNDPEVFPLGRFLRRTKLNEIPQLVNVIKGEMAIVGPRPLTEKSFNRFRPDVQAELKLLTPGVTGLSAVVFRDEEKILAASPLPRTMCYEQTILPRKAELEVWYARNASLWIDFRLMLATLFVVLIPKINPMKILFPNHDFT